FFNPFSVTIFKQVVENILQSVKEHGRSVDIIFYYPLPEFKKFLKKETPFRLINKVKAYKKHGKHGKFLIYRLD
ncbi:SAM-dependent methyltransferase, partial [Oceanobacillus sp. SE10311]